MAAVTICSYFGVLKNKVCHCFCCFPIYLPGDLHNKWLKIAVLRKFRELQGNTKREVHKIRKTTDEQNTKSNTQTETMSLEKGMATYSNMLARRTPCTEGPGGLQSVGWQRVRRAWKDLASKKENIRKNQREILQLKNALNVMENAMESYVVEKHLKRQEGQVCTGKALPFMGKGLHPVTALTLASYSLETDAIITWNRAMKSGNTNQIPD